MEITAKALEHIWIGILTALILVALGIFRNQLSSLVTRCFSVIRVHGNWETTIDRGSGPTQHEDVELRQFIHYVWGKTKIRDGERTAYSVQGRISGDRLCMVYRQADGEGFDCGAVLLSISVEGRRMEGHEIGVDKFTNKIYSYTYMWTKRY